MKTFPMFLQMAARRVVIVGGGAAAAQKVRLILRTEARLVLAARDPEPELAALAAADRADLTDDLSPDLFRGAALVFVATGCPALDRIACDMARAAGALVNVVDRPELCDAFTPSIVDRDPVVVAVSSEGTAPVLARQIRSRIETMLEPSIGALAALAGRLRAEAGQRIPRHERRFFWDWVFNGPPRQAMACGAPREAARLVKDALAAGGASPVQGSIALVDTGPGASDLLTLRALRLMQEADAICHHRQVDPGLLDLARRDAERIVLDCGAGADAGPQADVVAMMVAAARQGRRVVWLRPGNPGLSGRLPQGMEAAHAAGIPVEIVPGVTAACSRSQRRRPPARSAPGVAEPVLHRTGMPGQSAHDLW